MAADRTGTKQVKRSEGRKWQPGQSGNPAGRPAGAGKIGQLRKQIEDNVPEIITALVAKATAGDAGAARLLLERVLPPVKAMEQPQAIALPGGSLSDQGRAVLAAVASGEVAPSQGAALVAAIGSLARVVEVDELAARVAALEAKHGNKS